jgi:hypothetical protein
LGCGGFWCVERFSATSAAPELGSLGSEGRSEWANLRIEIDTRGLNEKIRVIRSFVEFVI